VNDVDVFIMSTYQSEGSVAFLEVHSVEAVSYGRIRGSVFKENVY